MDSKLFVNEIKTGHKRVLNSMSFGINVRIGSSGLHFHFRYTALTVLQKTTDSCLEEEKYKIDVHSLQIKFVLFSSTRCEQELDSSTEENGLKNKKRLELGKEGSIHILEVTGKHYNSVSTRKAPFTMCCLLHCKRTQIVFLVQ